MSAANADIAASDTKAKLIESARDIYLSEGLPALSMRKVARQAGMSTMATYRHFANKHDLINHVVLEGFQIFQRYFYRALEGSTPAERLQLSADTYLDFALENPKYYEVMFMTPAEFNRAEPSDSIQRMVRAAIQFLYDRISDCVTADVLEGPATRRKVMHLWSHSHGLVSLHLSGHLQSHTPFRELYRESMLTVFRGMGFAPTQ
jgi:AcrR family transcriptional regulator